MGDMQDLLQEMKEMASKQFAVVENSQDEKAKTLDLDINAQLIQSDYQQGEQSAEKEKDQRANILDDSNLKNDDEKKIQDEEIQVEDNQFNQNGENKNDLEGQQDQKERRKLRQYKTGYKDDNQSSDQQSEQSKGVTDQENGQNDQRQGYNRNRDDQQRGYGRGFGRGNYQGRGGYRGQYNRGYDRNDYGNQREYNRNDNQRYRDDNNRYGQDGRGQQRSEGYNYGSFQNSNYDNQQRSDYRNQGPNNNDRQSQRWGQRQDQRQDERQDQRWGQRQDQRQDQGYDQRYERFDNRNGQRQDQRQDARYDQRNDYRQDRQDYRYDNRQDNYKQNDETDYKQDNYRSYQQDQRQDQRQNQREGQRSEYNSYETTNYTNDNRTNRQSFKSNLSYQNQDRYQQISKFQENDYSQQRSNYQPSQPDQQEKVYLVDQTMIDESFILDQDREIKLVDKKFETNDTFIPNDFSKDFLTNGPLKQVYHFRTEFLRLASYHNINDIRQKIPSCRMVNQQHKFGEHDKFLLARPKTGDFNLHKAIKYGIWTFMEKRIQTVQKAYNENKNVYLIFLPHAGSKQEFMIRGLAKIVTNFHHDKHFQFWDKELSYFGVFHIEWLYVKNVPTRRIPKFTYQSNNQLCQCEISDLQDCSEIYWDDARTVLRELINAPDYPSLFDYFSAFDIQEDTTRYERIKSNQFTERLKEESDKFESRYKKQYR
ncbi:hypothetical protein pb186bvf_010064 [Paramecium bursaria]